MSEPRIVAVEWGCLDGRRPRIAGSNARLGEHGIQVRVPLARLTTSDGATGFGRAHISREAAERLVGTSLDELILPGFMIEPCWRAFEYPLLDLAGRRAGLPVYALIAESGEIPLPFKVACYDTSLYFDDLDLPTTEAAAQLIASEALAGWHAGHRAFKIKVGRGARHLPLEEGTRRDIAVIRAVRQAVGADSPIMIDANNGYNLNLTKHVLAETADCTIFWIEEAFHEDPVLYRDLKEWLSREGLSTLIADGEGDASPHLLKWAHEGLVNVIQYDIFGHGFSGWRETGRKLDEWGVRSAPHHYGAHYGNYVTCHLAGVLKAFTYTEWDEVVTPGLDASGYAIKEGMVQVPDTPGFGLILEEPLFGAAVRQGGFSMGLPE